MDFNAIRHDGPTIAVEGQASGEQPVAVTPEGVQAGEQAARRTTNADRIKAMADEELANLLSGMLCKRCPIQCPGSNHKSCADYWLDWLRKEAET